MAEPCRRGGFALITVLWLLSTIGVVAIAATASGRDEFDAAANRIALEREFWQAQGCASRIQSAIADSLVAAGDELGASNRVWRSVGEIVAATSPGDSVCSVGVEAAGSRLDANTATGEELDRLFDALRLSEGAALRDALLDWIDPDSEPRTLGAETEWYLAQGRPLPRNGPLASPRELTRVRGFEQLASAERFVSVEDPRIYIGAAPPEVLASIPAFSPAIVDHILQMRADGRPIDDLILVLDGVPQSDADSALARFPEIRRVTSLDPEAWTLTIRAAIRPDAPALTLEQRIERNGDRTLVARTRVLP